MVIKILEHWLTRYVVTAGAFIVADPRHWYTFLGMIIFIVLIGVTQYADGWKDGSKGSREIIKKTRELIKVIDEAMENIEHGNSDSTSKTK